ncbi:MAG: hypothetical protein ACRDOB_11510, partial [Streptosporangiaceae bacterium]
MTWGQEASGDLAASLRQAGAGRGDLVGLVVSPDLGLGIAAASGGGPLPPGPDAVAAVAQADDVLRPRWVVWS